MTSIDNKFAQVLLKKTRHPIGVHSLKFGFGAQEKVQQNMLELNLYNSYFFNNPNS